jgi:hypothetical protein
VNIEHLSFPWLAEKEGHGQDGKRLAFARALRAANRASGDPAMAFISSIGYATAPPPRIGRARPKSTRADCN